MTNSFRKAVSGLLLGTMVIGSSCLGVFAEAAAQPAVVNADSIRVFNEGAEIAVKLTGEPGEMVSVLMLEPGVNLPDMTTDYAEFVEGLAHADIVTLDEEGKATYLYDAEQAGIYTVRARGAEIDYTATNNEAQLTNPDRIYVEAWNSGGQYSHADLNYMIRLSKAQLDAYGAEAVARNIKQKLDEQAEGRRTIFLVNDLSPRSLCNNRIWWDEGVVKSAKILDEFFKALRDIGGTVDFVYSDTEQTFSMYALTSLANSGNADKIAQFHSIIGEISSDERYPEFEAKLVSRGYDTASDKGTPLSSICSYSNKYDNYLKFNAVTAEYAAKYITQAYYEPAKKYFANVKFADYGMGETKLWQGRYDIGGSHPNYNAGNTYKAGTHSAPVLYSKQARNVAYQEVFGPLGEVGSTEKKVTIYDGASADFKELQGTIVLTRISANSSEDGAITPWIATEGIESASFTDVRYRNEMLLHVALHNPDRLLYFNPNQDPVENAAQAEDLMKALDEVNELVAFEDRRSLNTEQADFSQPFALSGMYANGRNIWRIAPDTAVVTGNFLTSTVGGKLTFVAGGSTITFPGGRIVTVENTVSDLGYWVETAEGVMPVITYADSVKTETEAAVISFYNEVGGKADLNTAETVDAVAAYKGFYGDKMNFIAAKYDADGKLIDIEVKECGVFSPNGNATFFNIGKNLDTDSIKFFLWEQDTIRPLATEVIE